MMPNLVNKVFQLNDFFSDKRASFDWSFLMPLLMQHAQRFMRNYITSLTPLYHKIFQRNINILYALAMALNK